MIVDKTRIGKDVHGNNDNIDINEPGPASDVIENKIEAFELLASQEGSRTDTKEEELIEKDKIVDIINLSDEALKETDQEFINDISGESPWIRG